jgi:ribosomal protein S27E
MTDITARSKIACPACGGESRWNPQKGCLECPFCGTTTAVEEREGEVVERDLVAELRAIPDEKRGWKSETLSVRCTHCKAVSVFEAGRIGQRCEFCGSTQLVAYEEVKPPFTPEGVLPLRLSEAEVREKLKGWLRSVWFAPNNLSARALADRLHGMYLPYWTFDAQVEADWEAEAGHYYYTEESYTDGQGNRRIRRVRHTRWEYASGHVSHFFDDELVAATVGVDRALLQEIEPFPTDGLIPYEPSFLAGWTVEHYQIDLVDAASRSEEQMTGKTKELCVSQIPGDTWRNLSYTPLFSERTFKHILAPVWIVSYTYGARTFQVLVNGVTGAVAGRYPKSWVKITLAVIGALILAAIVLYYQVEFSR